MDSLTFLQDYWWFLIALLGALLVFLLFVQGGQALLYRIGRSEEERTMLVNVLGRKWELTFTTLVTFGGAFFASFPLFYSTSFGGAVYVWMAILFVFVLQAVAYEYRRKPGNVFGERTFEVFLMINGIAGPFLLGAAVGTLFTGANFTVDRYNMTDLGGDTVISQWTTPWHGLEALGDHRNILLGLAVVFLAGTLACQYFMNAVDDRTLVERARRTMRPLAVVFLAAFLAFAGSWLVSPAWRADTAGRITPEAYGYLHNLAAMPVVAALLLIGVVLVLWSILTAWRGNRRAIWFGGCGTVLTVLALLLFGSALLFRTWEAEFVIFYPNTTREVFLACCGRLRSILMPSEFRIEVHMPLNLNLFHSCYGWEIESIIQHVRFTTIIKSRLI